jgi:hypothetical protein
VSSEIDALRDAGPMKVIINSFESNALRDAGPMKVIIKENQDK